jgi:hypothetical protein
MIGRDKRSIQENTEAGNKFQPVSDSSTIYPAGRAVIVDACGMYGIIAADDKTDTFVNIPMASGLPQPYSVIAVSCSAGTHAWIVY